MIHLFNQSAPRGCRFQLFIYHKGDWIIANTLLLVWCFERSRLTTPGIRELPHFHRPVLQEEVEDVPVHRTIGTGCIVPPNGVPQKQGIVARG